MLDSIILGVLILILGTLIFILTVLIDFKRVVEEIFGLLVDRDIIDTVEHSDVKKEIVKDNPYINPLTGLYDYKYYKQNIRKG